MPRLTRFYNVIKSAAVGDALGAGIENWKMPDILKAYPKSSDLFFTRTARPNKPATLGQPGDVTDDTAMSMCVMAALNKTMKQLADTRSFDLHEFQQRALANISQSFLYWAQSQTTYDGVSGKPCAQYVTDSDWPILDEFTDTFGIGNGTMSILLSGQVGTLENLPVREPATPENPKPKFVDGCGALMRVAPVGLLAAQIKEIDAFDFGCRSGALTHGDASSYLSAGLFAELLATLINSDKSIFQSISELQFSLESRKSLSNSDDEKHGYDLCLKAIKLAKTNLREDGEYDFDIVDQLGNQFDMKLFATPPVLTQVLFVALAAEKHGWNADTALKFAAYQSGDSDSVASIVGNLLGAKGGVNAVPSKTLLDGMTPKYLCAIDRNVSEFMRLTNEMQDRLAPVSDAALGMKVGL